MKTGIIERMWQLGVGMLTGWVGLHLFLLAVLRAGGTVQIWHGVVWIGATFFGMWIVTGGQRTEDGGRAEGAGMRIRMKMKEVLGLRTEGLRTKSLVGGGRQADDGGLRTEEGGRKTEGGNQRTEGIWFPASGIWGQVGIPSILTCIAVLLPLAFSWVMGHFTDMSWDGMTSRGITVLKVMEGRPLTLDDDWVFGHIAGGWIALITGSWQGGKAINGLMILINLMVGVAFYKRLLGNSIWALVLGVLTALNPVAIYQLSSFQVDGITANFLCLLILGCCWLLFISGKDVPGLWLLAVSLIGLAASKQGFGMFYGSVVVLLFLAIKFWTHPGRFFGIVRWLAVSGLGSLLFFASQEKKLSIRAEGYGVGGGASKVLEYVELSRPAIFAASAFSMTEVIPEEIRLKLPFAMTRRELRVFEELTPDPRAGGFGPQFSGAMLLAGIGCSALLLLRQPIYFPGLFLVLAAVLSSYFSHLWWARWTPQNWLILIGMLMTLVHAGWKGEVARRGQGEHVLRAPAFTRWIQAVTVLAITATAFNVALVTIYYGVGMARQENVLNRQIELAKNLGEPVPIFIPVIQSGHAEGKSFLATKYWFRDRKVAVTELDAPPPKPRMELNKTETLFALPQDWRRYLKDPKDEALFRKRGCVED